jgi:hypothetical protein
MKHKISKKFLVFALFLTLSIINTYPLIKYFRTGMPYSHSPVKGYEVVPLIQGDYMQLYYVLWSFKDAIFGNTPLFSDPYQFSVGEDIHKQYSNQFFPMSLFFAIFSVFGNITAYNILVILSYILAGVSGYLLIKLYTDYVPSAILGGVIFSIFPYRVAQVLGGHPNGFLFFLIPLMIYFIEKSLNKNSPLYAIFAGFCILTMSLLESHFFYYSMLFLPFFLLFRILYSIDSDSKRDNINLKYSLLPFLTGIALSIIIIFVRIRDFNPLEDRYVYLALMFPFIFVLLSLLYGIIVHRLFNLPLDTILKEDSITYLPFLLFILYPLKLIHNVPHLGEALFFLSFLSMFILKGYNIYKNRTRFKKIPYLKEIIYNTIIPLFILILISIGWSVFQRVLLSKSILSGGRRFEEVSDYSPNIIDLFRRESISVEKNIYLGYLVILLAFIPVIFKKFRNHNVIFFLGVFIISLILSFGPNLDPYVPFYYILYKYLPGFNYQRVAGRIITFTVVSLTILAGHGLKYLCSSERKVLKYLFIPIIILVILDFHPFKVRGITIPPRENKVYEFIKNNIREEERVLEIPIWPGDSAWSSIYEYYVTLYKYRMINGYSAYITQRYYNEIFWGFYTLNLGEIRKEEYDILRKFKVRYIVMHEEAFPPKVSPFPFSLSLENMKNSPFVKFIKNDGPVYLFKVIDNPKTKGVRFKIRENYSFTWEGEDSQTFIGKVVEDFKASNGKAMFGIAGKTDGFLIFGQYITLPTGKYDAYFKLKIGAMEKYNKDRDVALIEVTSNNGENKLSKKLIKVKDFESILKYKYFDLPFFIDYPTPVEFRVYFKNWVDLWVDCIYVKLNKSKDD